MSNHRDVPLFAIDVARRGVPWSKSHSRNQTSCTSPPSCAPHPLSHTSRIKLATVALVARYSVFFGNFKKYFSCSRCIEIRSSSVHMHHQLFPLLSLACSQTCQRGLLPDVGNDRLGLEEKSQGDAHVLFDERRRGQPRAQVHVRIGNKSGLWGSACR